MTILGYILLIGWTVLCLALAGHHWMTIYFAKKGELIDRLNIDLDKG